MPLGSWLTLEAVPKAPVGLDRLCGGCYVPDAMLASSGLMSSLIPKTTATTFRFTFYLPNIC